MDLSSAIHLLGDILGEVISELESPEIFETEERIRAAAKERRSGNAEAAKQLESEVQALDLNAARAVSAAFTGYFDLVNLAEEYERVQQLRERESMLSPAPLNESVGDAIASLKNDGTTDEQLQALLDQLFIELVLTAHPTEARRRTVTSKIQRVASLLDQISSEHFTPREREQTRSAMHAEIASLFGGLLAPFEPNEQNLREVLQSPSWRHLAGTDEYGRDAFSRLIAGASVSMRAAVVATFVGAAVGVPLGMFAGFGAGGAALPPEG